MKVLINGDSWVIRVISEKAMSKKHGDVEGVVTFSKRLIEIDEKHIKIKTIFHELLHAYISYLHIDVLELDSDDLEEIHVEFFAVRGYSVLKQARTIFNKLKRKQ